uniref:Uncharacterized protein n=1 Tax=Triticum urartu TaxID=4572 RepID=A0A8R7QZB2_TRIUA
MQLLSLCSEDFAEHALGIIDIQKIVTSLLTAAKISSECEDVVRCSGNAAGVRLFGVVECNHDLFPASTRSSVVRPTTARSSSPVASSFGLG